MYNEGQKTKEGPNNPLQVRNWALLQCQHIFLAGPNDL